MMNNFIIEPVKECVQVLWILTGLGLIIIKTEPFYASLFIKLLFTFLISYIIFLIKDPDNSFNFSVSDRNGTDVSLNPIRDPRIENYSFRK